MMNDGMKCYASFIISWFICMMDVSIFHHKWKGKVSHSYDIHMFFTIMVLEGDLMTHQKWRVLLLGLLAFRIIKY